MNCPKCQSTEAVKDGFALGKQRYYCKECLYHFTSVMRKQRFDQDLKRNAIILYLSGLSINKIESLIGVKQSTLFKWVSEMGPKFNLMRSENKPILRKIVSKKDNAVNVDDKGWFLIYHNGVPEIRFK